MTNMHNNEYQLHHIQSKLEDAINTNRTFCDRLYDNFKEDIPIF